MQVSLLSVEGMMCQNSCGSTVQNALRSTPGIVYASASFSTASALVIHPTTTTLPVILEAIEMVGFDATHTATHTIHCHTFTIDGMMCQNSCGTTCTNALLTSDPQTVVAAHAAFATHSAVAYTMHATPTTPIDLAEAVEDVGFEATPVTSRPLPSDPSHPDVVHLVQLLNNALEKERTKAMKAKQRQKQDKKKHLTNTNQNQRTPATTASPVLTPDKGMRKMFFNVGGMSCASCSSSIEKHVGAINGVKEVKVALLAERAEVTLDTSVQGASQHQIIDTIRDLGFTCIPLRTEILRPPSHPAVATSPHHPHHSPPPPQQEDTIRLRIGGMSCASCSAKIEREVSAMPNILSVSVGLVTEQFVAVVKPGGHPGIRDIIAVVEELGFQATVEAGDSNLGHSAAAMAQSHQRTVQEWRGLFVFSCCFLLPMLVCQKVLVWIPFCNDWLTTHVVPRITWQTMIQLWLATPVQFYVGRRFYAAAWRGLKHRNCGMDFLIAMGTTAAYVYSIVSVVVACMVKSFHGNHFFETSAMLLTFVVMGKLMEAHAKGKTSAALTELMELQPSEALLVEEGGGEGEDELLFDINAIDTGECVAVEGLWRQWHGKVTILFDCLTFQLSLFSLLSPRRHSPHFHFTGPTQRCLESLAGRLHSRRRCGGVGFFVLQRSHDHR